MCASTVRCPPTRPHPWGCVLSHQGTRRTDTKHQECCATITQILPPAPPQPHKRAHSAPTSSVNHAGADHSPGKYSPAIPSSCARISSKGQSRSSVVALMRFPLDSVLYTPLSPQHEAWIRDIYSLVSRHDEARATPPFRSSGKILATDILSRHSAIANTLSTLPSEPTIETPKSES